MSDPSAATVLATALDAPAEPHRTVGDVPTPAADPSATLDALFQPFARSDQPGLVVGIARHGRPIYRKAFGLASVRHGVVNTLGTRMRIGSTTKHMACLAALLLAEDGRLDLDAPANHHLPELPAPAGMPTLRQLMTHTSGYRCSLELAMVANGQAMIPDGEQLARLYGQREANFAPGAGQLYCNGGYHLLSLAIDRVAGQPFEQFIRERVFEPLGMYDTAMLPSDVPLVPGTATLHVPDPAGGWRVGVMPSEEIRGEGGAVSTVDDMLRWIAHLNGPRRVGSENSWRQLRTPARLSNGLRSTYALGLNVFRWRGVDLVAHSGGVHGGACQMLTAPAHGLDVVILSNGAAASPIQLAYQVLEALLGDALEAAAPLPLAADFEHLDGVNYFGASGTLLGFARSGEHLAIRYLGYPPMPVLKQHEDRLRAGFEDLALGPVELQVRDLRPDADGRAPRSIDYAEAGTAERLARLERPADPARAFGRLLGRFHSHDLDADAELFLDGNTPRVRLRGGYGRRTLAAEALGDHVFALSGAGGAADWLLLWTPPGEGPASTFRLEALRARRLRFDRVA